MPRRAPTPCRYPGCAAVLQVPGYCAPHQARVHRDYGRARRGFDKEIGFYQSMRWRAVRAQVLRETPLCVACALKDCVTAAIVVDHVIPIKRGGDRYARANLQALCIACHNAKTAREQRG